MHIKFPECEKEKTRDMCWLFHKAESNDQRWERMPQELIGL